MMVPQHLNRLQLLPDEHLFAGKSSGLNPSLLKTVYANPFNVSQSKESRYRSRFSSASNKRANAKARQYKEATSKYDVMLLLRMALSKIPQIPFQYIMDIFRWNLFNGTISMENANIAFWELATNEQGIHPPDWENRKHFFDPGAKFHVADNTPFVR